MKRTNPQPSIVSLRANLASTFCALLLFNREIEMQTSNRHHANRPSRYTDADYARMEAAIQARERLIAMQRARERLARLAFTAMVIFLVIAMFYAGTN